VIEWASPWAFWLLVPAAALVFQHHLTGRNRLAVPRATRAQQRWTLRLLLAWVPKVLQVAGLICLVVALARPRIPDKEVVVKSEGLDIMLAIDTSGSMRNDDFRTGSGARNRLEVAKAVVAEFVDGRPYDRIGLVVFGEEAFTHVPLTLDHATLVDVLGSVQLGIAGRGGTAIGIAISVAAKRLEELDAEDKLVILLTDGQNNAGRVSPAEAAEAAGVLGIRVYTVGIGARRSAARRVYAGPDELDEVTLQHIADLTDAQYFRATNPRALAEIYEAIDELEPTTAEVEELVDHEELFRRWAIPGFLLLFAQVLLSATWLRRAP